MVEESNQNVFLNQIDASSFAEFEISEFKISRVDCMNLNTTILYSNTYMFASSIHTQILGHGGHLYIYTAIMFQNVRHEVDNVFYTYRIVHERSLVVK